MNRFDANYVDLIRMLSALEGGQLSENEFARLDELLGSDAEARAIFLDFIALHDDLRHLPLGELEHGVIAQDANSQRKSRAGEDNGLLRGASWRFVAIAASMAAIVAILWPAFSSSQVSQVATLDRPPSYVATLREADNAKWHSETGLLQAGSRLLPGRYQLMSGIAEIKFDCGATLVLKGATDLVVNNGSAANIRSGSVVFRSDGAGLHFTLTTPKARLMHFGTEYAVKVASTAEEIHVLEGEVHRLIDDQVTHQLDAGEAMRFGKTRSAAIPLASPLFVPGVSSTPVDDDQKPRAWDEGLIAFEPFSYTGSNSLQTSKANGGFGWAEQWEYHLDQPQESSAFVGSGHDLTTPGPANWGGYCWSDSMLVATRKLLQPIRMDQDGFTYFSFKCRYAPKPLPTKDVFGEIVFVFRPYDKPDTPFYKEGLRFTTDDCYFLVSRRNDVTRVEHSLSPNQDYLLVSKIVRGKKQPDQMFATIFAADATHGPEEPQSWTAVTPVFESDEVIDSVTMQAHSVPDTLFVDNIRIGDTWESVTSVIPDELTRSK